MNDTSNNTKSNEKTFTFTCKYCQQVKPLTDMVVVTKYFPAIIICRDCEKHLR